MPVPGSPTAWHDQKITFNPMTSKRLGNSDFKPVASSNWNLKLGFASSDTNIVSIIRDTLLHIKAVGSVTISAYQNGNDTTNGAWPVYQKLEILPSSVDCNGTVNGTATKDNCDRCVSGTTGKTACVSSNEIETDACSFDGAVENANAGFKGTGYINVPNAIGSKINFNVNATAAGSYTLSFRYASGGTVDLPATVLLNGTALANTLSFPATANFTTYKTTDLSLSLKSGINTIQLTSTTAEGLANIDQIGYVSTGVGKGNCVITSLDNIDVNHAVSIYPNPSKTSFVVYTANATNMQVVDMEGKMLEEHKNVSSLEFGVNLKPGIYLLKVDTKVYKVVKE